MKEQDVNVNEIEVKGYVINRPLQVNDPVAYKKDNVFYQGKIEKISKDGDYELKLYNTNKEDIKNITVPKGEKLEPLFFIDKNDKMVHLKYSFEEVKSALSNKNDLKVKLPDNKKHFIALMKGDKTDVLSIEKIIDGNFKQVEARLQMKRMKEGKFPYLSSDVKFKELNLDRPIYGKVLDNTQKEQLQKTGELGLVQGFQSAEGKEFKLWVSLDKELNKVVTLPEREIFIGKIFGVQTNEKQLGEIRSGQGTILEVKGKNYLFLASAAVKDADGIKSYTEAKAKELKLIPEAEEEKKNSKTKGVRVS